MFIFLPLNSRGLFISGFNKPLKENQYFKEEEEQTNDQQTTTNDQQPTINDQQITTYDQQLTTTMTVVK